LLLVATISAAPVLGIPEAKAGKLIVMVGGSTAISPLVIYCKTLAQSQC